MEMKKLEKSIEINAPKEKVWDVLIQDKHTKVWYAEFAEGIHADTDWKEGSRAVFKDKNGSGMVAKILRNRLYEELAIENRGLIKEHVEDYESEIARGLKGALEVYRLSGNNGATTLQIEFDTAPEYFDMAADSWDGALNKIKEFSENINRQASLCEI